MSRNRWDLREPEPCEPEVDEGDDVVSPFHEHDVGRLHVAMNDAHGVCRPERRHQLAYDLHRALGGERPTLGHQAIQGHPGNMLHDQKYDPSSS